jgi:polyketide biosynthesis acyl carrier protein
MTKEEIFLIVKANIEEVLPDLELDLDSIRLEDSLKELGANSIDRMEITVLSMEALGLKVPLVEFGQVSNLQGLVDLLHAKKQAIG